MRTYKKTIKQKTTISLKTLLQQKYENIGF